MAFVNLSLLLGTLLVAIPIVLHPVMRQKPKKLVFPAIRFIQKRQQTNRRSLRMRHWLLLLLRCLVIVAAALALARPSVGSHLFGNWLTIGILAVLLLLIGILFGAGPSYSPGNGASTLSACYRWLGSRTDVRIAGGGQPGPQSDQRDCSV